MIGETLTVEASDDESSVFNWIFNLYQRLISMLVLKWNHSTYMTGLYFDTIPVPVEYSLDDVGLLSVAELAEAVDIQSITGDEPVYHPFQQASEMFWESTLRILELSNSLVFAPVLEVVLLSLS